MRADFDQPLAAVHQKSSPSRAPSQCSAWTCWPARYRWPCRIGRGSPTVPEVNTISAGSSAPTSSAGAGAVSKRRSSGRPEQNAGEPRGGHAVGIALVDHDRARLHRVHAPAQIRRRSCSEQGWATAPMRQQASMAKTHSGRLPTTVMTTSPRPTPRAARAPARRRAVGHLAEVELASAPVSRHRHERPPARRRRVHHVTREVHAAGQRSPRLRRSSPSQAKSSTISTRRSRGTSRCSAHQFATACTAPTSI